MKFYILLCFLVSLNINAQFFGASQDINSDQILDPISKSIRFEIPYSTSNESKFEFFLKFKDGSQVSFDKVSKKRDVFTLGFSLDQYKKLLKSYRGKIAKLIVNESGMNNVSDKYKIYIGGPYDINCDHPVLLSDMNGTLDTGDSCTTEALNELDEKYKLPIFIVSSLGTGAKSYLNNMDVKNKENILILKKDKSSSFSSNEKALRIKNQVLLGGLCVLGFAGDSPKVEGSATEELETIQYFAVNLPKETSYSTYTQTIQKTICTLKDGEVSTYRKKESSCKSGWKETYSDLSYCKEVIETGKEGYSYFGLKNSTITYGKTVLYADYYCPYKKSSSKNTDGTTTIRSWEKVKNEYNTKLCVAKKAYEIIEHGLCLNGYKKITKDVIEEKEIRSSKAKNIPMKKYPSGSYNANDWCELKSVIIKKLEAISIDK